MYRAHIDRDTGAILGHAVTLQRYVLYVATGRYGHVPSQENKPEKNMPKSVMLLHF